MSAHPCIVARLAGATDSATFNYYLISIQVMPNASSFNSHGELPVKILSANGINLDQIDYTSLRMGPGGAPKVLRDRWEAWSAAVLEKVLRT